MSEQKTISLKTLLVPSKEVETEFPGMPDFKVKLCFLSRDELNRLRKKATKTIYKGRQANESLDEDLFISLYTQATIKGWSGLKLKYLCQLAPIDLEDLDPDLELPFDPAEAENLMRSSSTFDNFISEFIGDLGNFSQSKSN